MLASYIIGFLVALYLSSTTKLVNKRKIKEKGDFNIMGLAEIMVIGFLAVLGFLAFTNSRKVSQELKKLGANK